MGRHKTQGVLTRRQLGAGALGLSACAPLSAFGQSASSNAIQLRIGLLTPPPHNWSKAATAFATEIGTATNGQVKASVYPSAQLGPESQMLQLLQIGAMDIGLFTTSQMANRLVDFSAFYTPYIVENARQADTLLDTPEALGVLDKVNSLGLVGLGLGMAGMRQVVSRKDIRDIEDLKGLKVRVVPDAPLTDFWRKVGSAPSPVPLPSLYDAFANGQVDAMHIDFENTLRLNFYKHAKTILHSDHMIFPMVAVASRRSWESWPADVRAAVKSMMQTQLAGVRKVYIDADDQFKKELTALGANIIKTDSTLMADAKEKWLRNWSSRTPAVQELMDVAQGIIQQDKA